MDQSFFDMMGIELEVSLEGAATLGGVCALCGNLGGGDIFVGWLFVVKTIGRDLHCTLVWIFSA